MNPVIGLGRLTRAAARPALAAVVAAGLSLLTPPRPAPAAPAPRPATAPAAPVDIDDLPVTAPDVGKGIGRDTPAGARGRGAGRPILFTPRKAGATAKVRPTFYWYLPGPVEDDVELVVAITDPNKASGKTNDGDVVEKQKFSDAQPSGIYAATLEKPLDPGKVYHVSVVLNKAAEGNGEPNYPSSGGYLVYRPGLKSAAPDDPKACAAAGLWYDAVDAAVRGIRRSPSDAKDHRQLHGLIWSEHVFYVEPTTREPERLEAARADARKNEEAQLKDLAATNDAVVKKEPETRQ